MRIRAAVVSVLAGAALAVPAAPAHAAACAAATSGVTVVVDFASLGGGTHRECAPGDPSSGLAALRGAGFTPTRAAQEPGYFLCRINGKPANDPCQRTSPANAYWSYWHARPGGTWTYSSIGPADYDPAPGTVEGWAFGAGKPPSSPPPRPASPSPSPIPPATHAAAPTAPAASHQVAGRASPSVLTTSPTPTSAANASPSVEAVAPSGDAAPTPSGDAVRGISITQRTHSIPFSVIGGVLVLLLLIAATARQVMRRRRESGG